VVGSSPDAGATITRLSDGESAGCITDEHTAKLSNIPGALAMANNDAPNTGGSQFFVNVADNEALNWWTDGDSKHPVFGQVSPDGLTVIQSICKVETDGDEKPVKAIKVKTIAIR
jgi:cyclophilin family peptidyl-prolyl cis-trans isomerase